MSKKSYKLLFLIVIISFVTISISAQIEDSIKPDSVNQIENYSISIGQSKLNKSLWQQPYRFMDKTLKTVSTQLLIQKNTNKNEPLDFNKFSLTDDSNNLRIRPTAIFYYRGNKKIYLKSKSVNKNYDDFNETSMDGYENFEAETFKTNFLGLKKKKTKPSVKSLKRINIKAKKTTYYIDFPVNEGFSYGKIYYKNIPLGFAAVKN